MDISMPKLNGIEATRSILQRAPHAGAREVRDSERHRHARLAGAVEF